MGAKLLYKNEINNCHVDETKKYMNLQNWRALRVGQHHGQIGLYIIIPTCRMYFIPSMTIEQFNKLDSENKAIEVPYEYIKNVLTCERCHGKAKTDWITYARGRNQDDLNEYNTQFDYVRHKLGKVLMVNPGGMETPYYASTSFLHRGEEHCKDCCGTGLLFVQQWAVKRETTMRRLIG